MLTRISRASDSIWHTADLEFGDPHEDEAGWFRDKHNMYATHGSNDRNEELMTLVPGWDEAKRRGWKPLGGGGGPLAYRGTGDRFEVIAPKHLNPEDPHWDKIPQRWVRYSQGEGGMQEPYVMHADTFKNAANDRNLRGWNLYKTEYDPEGDQFHRVLNDQYPKWNGSNGGAGSFTDVFEDYRGGPGYFDNMRNSAIKRDKRLAGEV
jgi:hypothetical protein